MSNSRAVRRRASWAGSLLSSQPVIIRFNTSRSTRCSQSSTRTFPRTGSSSKGLPDRLLDTRDPSSVEEAVADIASVEAHAAHSLVVDNLVVVGIVGGPVVLGIAAVLRSYLDAAVRIVAMGEEGSLLEVGSPGCDYSPNLSVRIQE
ncbi:hypothetical protein BJY04DRAFT_180373 [Aspergillus karnatakaensis]|uniref:uncharacterized protein n=1 Tax=Aspergillus karnatakaensis TaxID=1810916 RepID=UPI003CCDA7F4